MPSKKYIETGAIDTFSAQEDNNKKRKNKNKNKRPKKIKKSKKSKEKSYSENNSENNKNEDSENENKTEEYDFTDAEKSLQVNIQKFVKIDNKIRKQYDKMKMMRESLKPKMEIKKKMEEKVTKGMKKNNIKLIKIDDGQIRLNEGKSKEPLKSEYILIVLKKYIKDKKIIKKIYNKLIDDRPEKDRYSIKRAKIRDTFKEANKSIKENSLRSKKKKDQEENSEEGSGEESDED